MTSFLNTFFALWAICSVVVGVAALMYCNKKVKLNEFSLFGTLFGITIMSLLGPIILGIELFEAHDERNKNLAKEDLQ